MVGGRLSTFIWGKSFQMPNMSGANLSIVTPDWSVAEIRGR
jgi:hypothetical protein